MEVIRNGKGYLGRGEILGSQGFTVSKAAYHKIDDAGWKLNRTSARILSFSTRKVGDKTIRIPKLCVIPTIVRTRRRVNQRLSDIIREALLHFCKRHPGVGVIIGGPLAPAANDAIKQHLVHDAEGLYAYSSELDCVPASIVSAVGCLWGRSTGSNIKENLKKDNFQYQKLGQVGQQLQTLGIHACIRKV